MNDQLLISRKGRAPKASIICCVLMLGLSGLLFAVHSAEFPRVTALL